MPVSVSNSSMNLGTRPKTNAWASLLPSASAIAVAWMLISYARFVPLTSMDISFFAASLSPFALASTIMLRSRRRIGYVMTVIGAALPLFWIYRTESRVFMNTWIFLNASEGREDAVYLRYAQLRIICAALLLFALLTALIRLLPSRWHVRKLALNRRSWPAFVITILVLARWFAAFAFPYRQPVIVDAMVPELSVLHVEKNGFDFDETRISVYRDGKFLMTHNDRRLFRYKFGEVWQGGWLTDALRIQLKTVLALPELQHTQDRAPMALRVAHGEGWYTEMRRGAIAAFTTENATAPPPEVVALFRGIVDIPTDGPRYDYEVRDVCLGFCYDPQAGLGYRALNQRCRSGNDTKEYCY